ncbi:MAG: sulfite exporter TauE/SafE family protein [Desulfobacterales bacterium]|jgi:uncharacterized membrane protein YfcA
MTITEILALPVVAFLAFFLKGIVGIGVGTVAIPILSLIIGAKQIVVLSAIVNVIGSLVMYRIDPQPASRRYWWPIAALMIIGAVLGGIALKLTPLESFEKILGMAILAAGIWFIIWRGKQKSDSFQERMPKKGRLKDHAIGLVGGFSGGFVGINSPIFILYFGSYLSKSPMRRLLVLILMPFHIAQLGTYTTLGLMNSQIVLYALISLPGLLLGIYLGNRTFFRISEKIFGTVLGAVLILLSWGLIL